MLYSRYTYNCRAKFTRITKYQSNSQNDIITMKINLFWNINGYNFGYIASVIMGISSQFTLPNNVLSDCLNSLYEKSQAL